MKFILAGGHERSYNDCSQRLARLVKSEVAEPKILSCFFSVPEDMRQQKHETWQPWFETNFGRDVSVEQAKVATFYAQLERSDVLYLHGGETVRLLEALPDFERFAAAIKGKLVIGSSAGANYLSTVNYSPSRRQVVKGAGIVRVAVIVHYGAGKIGDKVYDTDEWSTITNEVRLKAGESISCLLIPEDDFVIIEQ